MTPTRERGTTTVKITAATGVTWTRRPDGTSNGPELLRALDELTRIYGDLSQQWNWWEEGRREQEHDRVWQVLQEWDSGAPEVSQAQAEAFAQAQLDELDKRRTRDRRRRAARVRRSYDDDRAQLRLRQLRAESDAAFFTHVLSNPAGDAQRDRAQARAAESRTVAQELRERVGDPERVIDRHGNLPAERREWNLSSHMDLWRHRLLREWSGKDRRRFNALLKMPMPDPAAMCSECEAPSEWHEYDFSLRLFHPRAPAGSRAETMERLMPGWWDRCPACTAYQIEHRWGGDRALPDFTGEQWSAMLPPLLRTIFLPTPPKPIRRTKPKPQPLAVIAPGPISEVTAQLCEAQAEYPTARLRRGAGDSWELWPS